VRKGSDETVKREPELCHTPLKPHIRNSIPFGFRNGIGSFGGVGDWLGAVVDGRGGIGDGDGGGNRDRDREVCKTRVIIV